MPYVLCVSTVRMFGWKCDHMAYCIVCMGFVWRSSLLRGRWLFWMWMVGTVVVGPLLFDFLPSCRPYVFLGRPARRVRMCALLHRLLMGTLIVNMLYVTYFCIVCT